MVRVSKVTPRCHPLGTHGKHPMRHERRSSPYIWPAILAFCALASWVIDLPTAPQHAANTVELNSPAE